MLHYWKLPTNLPAYLNYKVDKLDSGTMEMEHSSCEKLHSDPVRCILLVAMVVSITDPMAIPTPISTLAMAPSLATLGSFSSDEPPGILLPIIWAELVLQPFDPLIISELNLPHCPILAASEGFSIEVLSATQSLYLDDAKLCFSQQESYSAIMLLFRQAV
jgi:hypothetical protein